MLQPLNSDKEEEEEEEEATAHPGISTPEQQSCYCGLGIYKDLQSLSLWHTPPDHLA